MRTLELRIPPLLVWFMCVAAMFGVARATPGLSLSLPRATVIALALAAAGVTVTFAGIVAFRRERTTVNPLTPGAASSVVTSGVYRYSRNPMYLGFLLTLAGWAVYLSNGAAVLLLPAYVAYMSRWQIQPEERALLARFGPEYAQYLSRVRRWI